MHEYGQSKLYTGGSNEHIQYSCESGFCNATVYPVSIFQLDQII